MNKKLDIKDRSGNLLIESIVSISVIILGFLGVIGLLSRSLGANKDVSQKFVATYLAAEGVEVVKSLIDKGYADGLPWNDCCSDGSWEVAYNSTTLSPAPATPRRLLLDESTGIYSYSSGVTSPFSRVIEISEVDWNTDGRTDELRVNSRVSWSVRGTTEEVSLEDHFFDWR